MASRRQQFVYGQLGWMLATIVGLAALGSLSLDLVVIVSVLGLLSFVELTAPLNVTPRWRARLRWLLVLAVLAFGYVIALRIRSSLPEGVFA